MRQALGILFVVFLLIQGCTEIDTPKAPKIIPVKIVAARLGINWNTILQRTDTGERLCVEGLLGAAGDTFNIDINKLRQTSF